MSTRFAQISSEFVSLAVLALMIVALAAGRHDARSGEAELAGSRPSLAERRLLDIEFEAIGWQEPDRAAASDSGSLGE